MIINRKISDVDINISIILILLFSYILIELVWIININTINILICPVISAITIGYIKYRNNLSGWKKLLLKIFSFGIVSIIVGRLLIVENGSDGYTAHLGAVWAIAKGWNPVWDPTAKVFNSLQLGVGSGFVLDTWYVKNVTKFIYFNQSIIYILTKSLETSNCFYYFICAIVFQSLYKISEVSPVKKIILIILAISPIMILQSFDSYHDKYVSLFMGATILCIALNLGGKLSSEGKNIAQLFIVLLACSKLQGLFYSIILYFLYLFSDSTKNKNINKKIILIGLIALIVPYMTNLIFYRNILGSFDVNSVNFFSFKPWYVSLNKITGLFYGIFSETGIYPDVGQLKIPFTFTIPELKMHSADSRMGGFGPLFSGIFIVGLYIYILLIKSSKNYLKIYLFGAILLVQTFILPITWFARFEPQVYYFSTFPLMLVYIFNIYTIKRFLYLVLVVSNLFLFIPYFLNNQSIRIVKSYDKINLISNEMNLIYFDNWRAGRLIFNDKNIKFRESEPCISENNQYIDTAIYICK